MKIAEFKASDPWDYKASADKVEVLELQARKFVWIDGEGDPNGEGFDHALAALYGLSYAVRMSYRADAPPPGAGEYTVGVLQGRWTIVEGASGYDVNRKDLLAWSVMIRQPDFLDEALFQKFRAEARAKAVKKKADDTACFDRLHFGTREAGRYAQLLHLGPYDDEPASFARMEALLAGQGLKRRGKHHWEIYLGDPRRTAAEKLKTILRVELES